MSNVLGDLSKVPGAKLIHGAVSEQTICALEDVMHATAGDGGASVNMSAERRWFKDEGKWGSIIAQAGGFHSVLPDMRFVIYQDGGFIAPHADGVRFHEALQKPSDHSFLLYMTNCPDGGPTRFFASRDPWEEPVAQVFPRRGDLLCFPHDSWHDGDCVAAKQPKVLLRGDGILEA